MKTLDLNVNWLFFVVAFSVVFFVYSVGMSVGVAVTLMKVLAMAGAAFVLLFLILGLTHKRFLHVDRAGVSYRWLGRTRYLAKEDVVKVEQVSLGLVKVPRVHLVDGKCKTFYSWSITDQQQQRASTLLSD
ncbi:hypothetical protein ACSLBF_00690 [Pseudoalteromonas sp. T1lg65]|uniref:hypothetical protein n=1 Tax=Pseudoalteromonas sp. T1lg65 TaxID=2077101 RepID=UPI003F79558D